MKTKLLLLLCTFQFLSAQNRTCGMKDEMKRLMADPIEKQNYLEMQARFRVELAKITKDQNRTSSPTVTIKIPVAVHFPTTLGTASASLKTCLRNLAQTQVNILNADYGGFNADAANWAATSALYPGINRANLNIEFVIATRNHPTGTGLVNGDPAVTFGTDFLGTTNTDITWTGYMNLVCRNAGTNILGYSPLGGNPGAGRTVVIAFKAFGSGAGCTGYVPGAPYNLGRTLTHELGHFFNLDHTFISGDDTATDCTPPDEDGIADTPKTAACTYGCPDDGVIPSCEAIPALTMNYMDYTNDACMYMFTAGQAATIQAWYNTIAPSLTTNTLANNSFLTNNFSIAPNPTNGNFTINLKEVLQNYEVQIFDPTGKIIFEKEYLQDQGLQQSISLDNAAKGVYFVNIKSNDAMITKKIICN